MTDTQKLFTPHTDLIFKAFLTAGADIRIVGGAVRDTVLGVTPKDIDFATTAIPDEMIRILGEAGIRYVPTGLHHGTISAILDDVPYEITTLRIDAKTDGRHADVEFTTNWRDDAERRDFTMNAMSVDSSGVIHDYFGGQDDAKMRNVRFVGDTRKRIREDYLRILRYFRFRGRIGDVMPDYTVLDIIREEASGLRQISGERIWWEFSSILSNPKLDLILGDIQHAGVFPHVGIENYSIWRAADTARIHRHNLTILGGMLDDRRQVEALNARWKFSAMEKNFILWLVEEKALCSDLTHNDLKQIACNPKLGREHAVSMAAVMNRKDLFDFIWSWVIPKFPITGQDVLNLGIKTGPRLGALLHLARQEWVKTDYTMDADSLIHFLANHHLFLESVNEHGQ